MPWALLFLIPSALIILINGKYLLALVFSCSILYVFAFYPANFLPKNNINHDDDSARTLKVMSFNVWSKNQDITAIEELVSKYHPDVFFLQEINAKAYESLVQKLESQPPGKTPYSTTYDSKTRLALLSVFKLREIRRLGSEQTRVQSATVSVNGKKVALYNVHFIRINWHQRISEVSSFIDNVIKPETGPILLGGDFNSTGQTLIYMLINDALIDSHDQVGVGFGFTYPSGAIRVWDSLSLLPLVRIDHIFHSRHFDDISAQTITTHAGSDHLPIISTLDLSR
jgi:endonuclease/exonuclease/phosphatase family metal-dependent hydrolase